MRAITIAGPERLEQVEIDAPGPPGEGEVLVATHRMGVCGTDVSSFLGKFPFFQYPRIPGHELGVEVLTLGAGVEQATELRVGDRCSVEPYMNCGSCYACRQGRGNCCRGLNVIGVMSDGGLCERFLIPAAKLHRSETLSFEQLALVETLAIGCHATERAAPREGEQVLIIGAGPIGLSTLEFTRLSGAKVTVMDMDASRLEFCRQRYGIENTVLVKGDGSELEQLRDLTAGDFFAVVTDATGHAGSMANALNYVAHTGRLVYLGVTSDEIVFPHPLLHRPEMTLMGSRNALPADFGRCIDLIERGEIDTDPWITHRVGFDEVVAGFAALTRPEAGVLKAMIEVA